MNADPIVQQMIEDAQAGGTINRRAHLTDPQVISDMIEEERNGIERRQHARGEADRRNK